MSWFNLEDFEGPLDTQNLEYLLSLRHLCQVCQFSVFQMALPQLALKRFACYLSKTDFHY